jgi:hypothetical protein
MIRISHLVPGALLVFNSSNAAPVSEDFPLTGTYTQNVPCKGDGTDPAELQVKISPEGIESNISVCSFLSIKQESSRIDAHVQCKFRSGPLTGNVSFTLKSDNTVAFTDKDRHYQGVLYRCPN